MISNQGERGPNPIPYPISKQFNNLFGTIDGQKNVPSNSLHNHGGMLASGGNRWTKNRRSLGTQRQIQFKLFDDSIFIFILNSLNTVAPST